MRYIIKQVNCCPEGAVQATRYHVADSEGEMESIINANLGGYTAFTCLGPVVELSKHIKDLISRI